MRKEELRIGNWVSTELENEYQVKEIHEYIIVRYSEDLKHNIPLTNINPIPLTEEWLLGFGFDNDPNFGNWHLNDYRILKLKYFYVGIKENTVHWYNHSSDDFYSSVKKVKYVHQLQNLYFALTGEELKQIEK